MGPGGFVPTHPDLADILGRTDLDFENFYFLDLLAPNLGPAWARLGPGLGPGLGPAWARLGPGLGPKLGPGLGLGCLGPGWGPGLGPDAAAGAGRILRSQPDPSPNAPRDQIRRKDPCCDYTNCSLVVKMLTPPSGTSVTPSFGVCTGLLSASICKTNFHSNQPPNNLS